MIDQSWVEKQVLSMNLGEIKVWCRRKRLRFTRQQIVLYVMALAQQQHRAVHFKAIHAQMGEKSYQGFMKNLAVLSPFWAVLEERYRRQAGIGFDNTTVIDSSLLPSKNEEHITEMDWKGGRATLRKKGGISRKVCGEKCLTVINSAKQLVYNRLMDHINCSDQNVLKNPYTLVKKGLRRGVLLMDRGFSNRKVYEGVHFLNQTLPGFDVSVISPPHPKQKWQLTPEQQQQYKKRWSIEEVYRQLKEPFGPYKLTMRGVRRRALREARVAIATLAWNMQHT